MKQRTSAATRSSQILRRLVSGSGGIDLRLPVFASGKVRALIITTTAGAKRLRKQSAPDSVEIRAIQRSASAIPASAILDEVCRASPGKPRRGRAAIAGKLLRGRPHRRAVPDSRAADCRPRRRRPTAQPCHGKGVRAVRRLMGKAFAPCDALWGTLIDVRRGSSHLFLRYSFPESPPGDSGPRHPFAYRRKE
jgi:hypothetical protein